MDTTKKNGHRKILVAVFLSNAAAAESDTASKEVAALRSRGFKKWPLQEQEVAVVRDRGFKKWPLQEVADTAFHHALSPNS
ncbi:MAG: hypothetical protein LBG47_01810 [Prevotellaceae bacterium]|jgi:hypothetical protein|nr:hypothetical protein [Prevotellaceae bacterium]